MERQHHTSGAPLHPPGDESDGRAGDGRIGIQAAERMEMTLRSPDRGQAVLVRKLRPFDQQSVFVLAGPVSIAGKIKEAEVHPAFRLARARVCGAKSAFLPLYDHFETACERPEQF